ncbi:MAG: hypothetical protein WDA24_10605 [Tissierellales bacterium]
MKEKCLECNKSFEIEDMINGETYLGEGFNSDITGYFCKDCVEGKEWCNYCGRPVDEIFYIEYANSDRLNNHYYCKDCYEEIKEYIEE